jgi:hypothetical protein
MFGQMLFLPALLLYIFYPSISQDKNGKSKACKSYPLTPGIFRAYGNNYGLPFVSRFAEKYYHAAMIENQTECSNH